MKINLRNPIPLNLLLEGISLPQIRSEVFIEYFGPLKELNSGGLGFILEDEFNNENGAIVFGNVRATSFRGTYIITKNPRLSFVKAIEYFVSNDLIAVPEKTSDICKSVVLGKNVQIGNNVTIKSGTKVEDNVTIKDNTIIGHDCLVRSGADIGGDGFGFEFDENNIPLKFHHFGGVYIGNNVEVGANTCIARGTLSNTEIGDNTKIDNLVHIGHNCTIAENCLIIAGAVLGGGVVVGKNCWIGPNSSVIHKVSVGSFSKIGIGACVLFDVAPKTVLAQTHSRQLPLINK